MLKFFLKAVIVLIVIYLTVLITVFLLQRKAMYFPPPMYMSPEVTGLENINEVKVKTSAGDEVTAWWQPPSTQQAVVMFFHGNGSAVYDKTYVMDAWGDEEATAMARLVSIPVSLAVEAVLNGEIESGVTAAPSSPELIDRWITTVGGIAQHWRTAGETPTFAIGDASGGTPMSAEATPPFLVAEERR